MENQFIVTVKDGVVIAVQFSICSERWRFHDMVVLLDSDDVVITAERFFLISGMERVMFVGTANEDMYCIFYEEDHGFIADCVLEGVCRTKEPVRFVVENVYHVFFRSINDTVMHLIWDRDMGYIELVDTEIPCKTDPIGASNRRMQPCVSFFDEDGEFFVYELVEDWVLYCLSDLIRENGYEYLPIDSSLSPCSVFHVDKVGLFGDGINTSRLFYFSLDGTLREVSLRENLKYFDLSYFISHPLPLTSPVALTIQNRINIYYIADNLKLCRLYWNRKWKCKQYKLGVSNLDHQSKLKIFRVLDSIVLSILSINQTFTILLDGSEPVIQEVIIPFDIPEISFISNPKPSLPAPIIVLEPYQVKLPYRVSDDVLESSRSIKLVIVSDTHNLAEQLVLPPGDILIHAGDFTDRGTKRELKKFTKWLDQLEFDHKIVVAGNHEMNTFVLNTVLKEHCIYLSDKSITVEGLKIHGASWRGDWKKIKSCDVLITHRPPTGHGDISYNGKSEGSNRLLERVDIIKPILHIFGHNHEGYGSTRNEFTTFVNAGNRIGKSNSLRPAIIIDIYPDLKLYL